MQDFRQLFVWQTAQQFAVEIHALVGVLPPAERFRLGDQMIRAALSVPANIAEGTRRSSDRDFARCLRIALGSLAETESFLDFAMRHDWVPNAKREHVLGLAAATRRRLIRLLQKLTEP